MNNSEEKKSNAKKFVFDNIDDAVVALCDRVKAVEIESIALQDAPGRILAQPVTLDRPSPACSVSAMDGYALRMADARPGRLAVAAEIQAGQPACDLPEGVAVRIFTGGMVPKAAQLVIQREHVQEQDGAITLPEDIAIKEGQHIRVVGENGQPGTVLCEQGKAITPPMLAAMSSVGMTSVKVYKRLRVGILVTGGEILEAHQSPEPWQIRDSNGPALTALFGQQSWLAPIEPVRVHDEPEAIRSAITALSTSCDVLLLTGGVSAGDYDFVPSVLREMGATIVFHKLPLRPGKPVLGAVSESGCPIFGLPGNPVSVMVCARRLAMVAMRKRGGMDQPFESHQFVQVVDTYCAPPGLTWFPLVRIGEDGQAHAIGGKGSGDWVSAAQSDGFVQVPPGESMEGNRRFFAWPGYRG